MNIRRLICVFIVVLGIAIVGASVLTLMSFRNGTSSTITSWEPPWAESKAIIEDFPDVTKFESKDAVQGFTMPVIDPEEYKKWARPTTTLQTWMEKLQTNPPNFYTKSHNTLGFDNIYVINRKVRPERLAALTKYFEAANIGFEVYHGKLDSTSLSWEQRVEQLKMLNSTDPNDSNIMTSIIIRTHLHCMKDMLKKGYETIVVCEDDIAPAPKFTAYYEDLLRPLLHGYGKEYGWDICYLRRVSMPWGDDVDIPEMPGYVIPNPSWGTNAYAVSRKGAEKIIRNFENPEWVREAGIDTAFEHWANEPEKYNNVKFLAIKPDAFLGIYWAGSDTHVGLPDPHPTEEQLKDLYPDGTTPAQIEADKVRLKEEEERKKKEEEERQKAEQERQKKEQEDKKKNEEEEKKRKEEEEKKKKEEEDKKKEEEDKKKEGDKKDDEKEEGVKQEDLEALMKKLKEKEKALEEKEKGGDDKKKEKESKIAELEDLLKSLKEEKKE